jgi:hypothetical protein
MWVFIGFYFYSASGIVVTQQDPGSSVRSGNRKTFILFGSVFILIWNFFYVMKNSVR